MHDDDPPLTVAEAACWAKVDVQTIWRWIKRGALEAVKLPSGHWRIYKTALRACQVRRST